MARYSRKTIRTNTVIIGAGAAGLASAACLRKFNVPFVVLEKHRRIGSSWLHRYERLHLHTHRRFSSLPYLSFPKHCPAYPSRIQFVDYLERYADAFHIKPRFGERVKSIMRIGGLWSSRAKGADYLSRNLIIATGYSHSPVMPSWPGLNTFSGTVLHSSRYVNGEPFEDQHVLVVGFGNSGAEIALDLHEHHAKVSLSIRGPVNVVPRDLFGLSTHAISVRLNWLPPKIIDALSAPLVRMSIGELSDYGLQPASIGPLAQIEEQDRVPLLDIGTLQLIRQGHITVYDDVSYIDDDAVYFKGNEKKTFDAIIFATGFRNNVASFLRDSKLVTNEDGSIIGSGKKTALPGLYFCGFNNAPFGLLRELGIEAKRIAGSINSSDKSIPIEKEAPHENKNP